MARAAQISRQADTALRELRRLKSMAEQSGYLILPMACAAALAELSEAREAEMQFREARGIEV